MKREEVWEDEKERERKCDYDDIRRRTERSPEEAEAERIQIDFLEKHQWWCVLYVERVNRVN